jgi:hypothetical protein
MAKKVSGEKLRKIEARGNKRRAEKETRQNNRVKKLGARKGLTEKEAKDLKANRKQRRLEKFETSLGIRQGVTTEKYKPEGRTAGDIRKESYAKSFGKMANDVSNMKIGLMDSNNKLSENVKLREQEQNESPLDKIVTPFTMKTSCKY